MTLSQENENKNVNSEDKPKPKTVRTAAEKKPKTTKQSRNVRAMNPEFMTRIVVRQLPPTMTEEQFLEAVSPLPAHKEFYYVNGDLSLGEFAFSRAYVKFNNIDDVLCFKDKFDDYVFVDSKGNEYPAVVEYAPLQRLARRFNAVKKDTKINTLESDPDFIAFKEALENPNQNATTAENVTEVVADKKEAPENSNQTAPLVEYLNKKRMEKFKMKEEKKRKKNAEKKKQQEESKAENTKMRNEKKEQQTKKNDPQQQQSSSSNKEPAKKAEKVKNKNVDSNKQEKVTKPIIILKPEEKPKPSTSQNIKKNSNETGAGTSPVNKNKERNKKNVAEAEEKRKERIRNKDRPAREIYRPAARRDNNSQPSVSGGGDDQQPPMNGTNEASGSTGNDKNSSSQAYKYPRIFTRTKQQQQRQ